MQNLADVALNYLWFLEFSDDEELDPDRAVKLEEELSYQIQDVFTDEERQALSKAAARRLKWWLQEPDEHGYTPRKLLTANQKAFLEAISEGRFDGYDFDVTDD